MTTEEAVKHLCYALRNDEEYFEAWKSNIAMAYKDNELWYKEKTGKKYLSKMDKHIIANNAAKYFLDLLLK